MNDIKYPELVAEMAKHKESQISLGKLIGLSRSTINKRMAGTSEFSISEIDKICEHYGKTYEELFKKGVN